MFGKTKKIADKINGKEEVVKDMAPKPKPKGRVRKPKEPETVKAEVQPEEVEETQQSEEGVSDDDILHNIDQDLGAANYMLRKRDIQELIDGEGVRIWSDILMLAEIALQDEAVQQAYVKEYKVVEMQRMVYQQKMIEAQKKQQEVQQEVQQVQQQPVPG